MSGDHLSGERLLEEGIRRLSLGEDAYVGAFPLVTRAGCCDL
jgi:hypothetical protein